jgi:hypothetical protein
MARLVRSSLVRPKVRAASPAAAPASPRPNPPQLRAVPRPNTKPTETKPTETKPTDKPSGSQQPEGHSGVQSETVSDRPTATVPPPVSAGPVRAVPRPTPSRPAPPPSDPTPVAKALEVAETVVTAEPKAAEPVEAKAAEAVEVELDIAPDPEPQPAKSLPPPLPSGPRLVPESSSACSPPPESSPSSAAPIPLVQLRVATPEPSPVPVQRPPAQSIGRDMDAAFLREAANDSVAWESASLTDDDDEIADERIAFKMTDEARLRRAHLAKYVKAVVAGCALLCVAAVVRLGVGTASEPSRAPVSEVSPSLPPVAPPANAASPSIPVVATPAPVSQPTPAAKTMRAALRETKHPSPFRP